jgi:hypothetical protein
MGVHTFHLYGWKPLFHFTEGGLPPSLSDMTHGPNPDPSLRRAVHALVPEAQLAAQVLLKRPLVAPSLSQVLPNRGYRLPHIVKGPPARIHSRQPEGVAWLPHAKRGPTLAFSVSDFGPWTSDFGLSPAPLPPVVPWSVVRGQWPMVPPQLPQFQLLSKSPPPSPQANQSR